MQKKTVWRRFFLVRRGSNVRRKTDLNQFTPIREEQQIKRHYSTSKGNNTIVTFLYRHDKIIWLMLHWPRISITASVYHKNRSGKENTSTQIQNTLLHDRRTKKARMPTARFADRQNISQHSLVCFHIIAHCNGLWCSLYSKQCLIHFYTNISRKTSCTTRNNSIFVSPMFVLQHG